MPVKKIKVLIAEDEETLSHMYQVKFEKDGFIVEMAPDGQEALKKAKEFKPDIILLDIIMPQLDGFSVLEQLRKDKNFAEVPIIMLTNLGQSEDVEKGKKLGADDYLVKANCTPMDVVSKVREHIKK